MIRFTGFRGVVPRVNARKLGNVDAQIASLVDIRHGDLQPFNTNLKHNTPTKSGVINTIFRWADSADSEAKGQVTNITQANPAQVTSVGHGRTTGQRINLAVVGGMTEVNDIVQTITVIDDDNYTLNGVDSTGYTAYTSGGDWILQNGYFLHWSASEAVNGVDVARSQIDSKTDDRIYFTGKGSPKMTFSPLAVSGGGTDYPTDEYLLGIPAPTTAPTVAVIPITGTITGATQANPVVITDVGHGRATSQSLAHASVGGMTELNGNTYVITVIDDDSFSLNGVDGTGFTAYTSGGTWTLISPGNPSSHSYVYTYLTNSSEEGPPSPPSTVLDVEDGETVNLSSLETGPAGDYDIASKKIYRSVAGATGARFYYVATIALVDVTDNDDPKNTAFQEAIITTEWDPPPTDMQGIINMPNGITVGFSKNEVCFSVPYQPHAWPTSWRQTVESTITGIAVYGTTVVVGTETYPSIIYGTHPSSMTMKELKKKQACNNRRSMTSLGDVGVGFASPDGLMAVVNGQISNLTKIWFSSKEWKALDPYSIHCYYWDDKIVFFYDNGTTSGGYVIDFDDPTGRWMIELPFYADHAYVDRLNDKLFMLINGDVVEFDGGFAAAQYTWKSRKEIIPRPKSFSVAQIIAADYTDTTLKIYADDVLVTTTTVINDSPIRFNANGLHRQWEAEVISKGTIEDIIICESVSELAYL